MRQEVNTHIEKAVFEAELVGNEEIGIQDREKVTFQYDCIGQIYKEDNIIYCRECKWEDYLPAYYDSLKIKHIETNEQPND